MRHNNRPKLTRLKAKGWLKWFKKDKFILEYEYVSLTGDWDDGVIRALAVAGERPVYNEET